MMTRLIMTAALACVASGMAFSAPVTAMDIASSRSVAATAPVFGAAYYGTEFLNESVAYNRSRYDRRADRRYTNARNNRRQDERIYRDTRTWRGSDGRHYCQKKDGTTGLIIGGAAGALLGRELSGRGDRTLGTVLGAAGGALLGNEIAGGVKCR